MGRKPRVEFRGATYHVFARGNRREKIFHDDDDYAAYVDDLRIISGKEGVEVLAFCRSRAGISRSKAVDSLIRA